METVKISVRNLVEFILREGDIDNRTTSGPDKEAMQLGGRIHRKIQRQMGSDYSAEVSLGILIPCEGFDLKIEGRADGIIEEESGAVIDEIKGVLREVRFIEDPIGVHLAQAKCYAYMLAKQEGLKEISVQMTYCQMETEEIKRFRESYPFDELEEWFLAVVKQYEKWARFELEWKETRNQSIKGVDFPFAYREGQKELVVSVYKTILRQKGLFIQAPTGVGKTIAAVFPAVKAVGERLGEKIFYLTAKTITRTVASNAFEALKQQALRFKVIVLTAKDKICFCEETDCNPEYCPYAKGHYDRVNDAIYEMITTTDDMSREALEAQAEKYSVCPHEMALDISMWADAVICDYNYVFDPTARLKRYFYEGNKGDYIFLIDEAHNLVERGREMYSAAIYKEDILRIKRLVRNEDAKLARRLEESNKLLLTLKRECETYQIQNSASHAALKLMNVMAEMERFLEECQNQDVRQEVLNFYFDVRMFINIHERVDENYVIYTELEKDGRFKLKLFCVNPAVNLQECLDQGNSTVFFSATLLPIDYYKTLLSTEKDNYAIYAESPFDQEQRLLLLGNDVSTRYTQRSDDMYERFAAYIWESLQARKGNYIVFFPSYRFMTDVHSCFMERVRREEALEDIECILQSQYMSEEAREIFLENFEEERDYSLVGFCVMGGIFAEGIDLVEDKLIGAIIVGTGLPQVCCEREILKQHFDERGMPGFDFSYLYPGMNKVLQAAGRVIRTDADRGMILLLDERFMGNRYREVFPREWNDINNCRIDTLRARLEKFWSASEHILPD